MRVLRFLALFGSIALLVSTTVLVVERRSDIRAEQFGRIEQAATLTDASVRSVVIRLREDVDLLESALTNGGSSDHRQLAEQLVRFFPGAEACVGTTSTGCTGSDLFAFDAVAELAGISGASVVDRAGSQPVAAATVDTTSDAVVVVRRVPGIEQTTIAVRLPVDDLVAASGLAPVVDVDADVEVTGRGADAADQFGEAAVEGDERVLRSTIGSVFVSGSLEVTTAVDATIGFAGESSLLFAVLLALGTVLMAMAAWTYFVERRQLERRATTDELTDLVNRREFERISAAAIDTAYQKGEGLCVMVVDLNGFKQINDTLGHPFGDLVLTAASERFVEAVRDTDVVGRWGGDEFVILLPTLDERGAVRRSAERIYDHLTSSPVVGDTTISGSIGAAIYPRHGATLDALMQAADVAMYDAKSNGVSYRIADTIETNESMFVHDTGTAVPQRTAVLPVEARPVVETDGYVGPERRTNALDELSESESDDAETGARS